MPNVQLACVSFKGLECVYVLQLVKPCVCNHVTSEQLPAAYDVCDIDVLIGHFAFLPWEDRGLSPKKRKNCKEINRWAVTLKTSSITKWLIWIGYNSKSYQGLSPSHPKSINTMICFTVVSRSDKSSKSFRNTKNSVMEPKKQWFHEEA